MNDSAIDSKLIAAIKQWQNGHACAACERPEAEYDEGLLCETMRRVSRALDLLDHGDPSQEV